VRDGNRVDMYNVMVPILTSISWCLRTDNIYIYTFSGTVSFNYFKIKYRRRRNISSDQEIFEMKIDHVCIRKKEFNLTKIWDQYFPTRAEYSFISIFLFLPNTLL
jgi:hypothetical protein